MTKRFEDPRVRELAMISLLAVLVKGICAYLLLHFGGAFGWFVHLITDVWSWTPFFEKTAMGLIPYVDFSREYPVGAGLVYWLISLFLPDSELGRMLTVHTAFFTAFEIVNTVLFFSIVREMSPKYARLLTALFALNPTALILVPFRYESVVTLFVLLGYRSWRKKEFGWSAFWWTIGSGLKWYPLFFLAAQEIQRIYRDRQYTAWIRSAAVFVLGNLLIHGPFLLWSALKHGNIDAWLGTYAFHINRPLYWDTLLGVIIVWTGPFPLELWASKWSLALMALATFLKPRTLSLEARSILICVAAIIFNRVYSTQFHLWFYPFLFFLMAQLPASAFRKWFVLFVVLDAINILVYPFGFAFGLSEMKNFEPYAAAQNGGIWTVIFSAAIVSRTLLLGVLTYFLARRERPGKIPR